MENLLLLLLLLLVTVCCCQSCCCCCESELPEFSPGYQRDVLLCECGGYQDGHVLIQVSEQIRNLLQLLPCCCCITQRQRSSSSTHKQGQHCSPCSQAMLGLAWPGLIWGPVFMQILWHFVWVAKTTLSTLHLIKSKGKS